MISDALKKIIEQEKSDLFDLPVKPTPLSAEDRLIQSFSEINEYIDKNGEVPKMGSIDIYERRLYSRLEGIRNDSNKVQILRSYDKHNVLASKKKTGSLEEILSDNELDLLEDDSGILSLKNVPVSIEGAEYKGKQKRSEEFHLFEGKFTECHEDLRAGRKTMQPFSKEQQIHKGEFFILKGVMVYVAEVGDRYINKNGKKDARLRLIYENGTESDILLRTLARELYRDGRRIVQVDDETNGLLDITDDDKTSGYIYVVQSLSEHPEIKSIKNLYKIGYSSISADKRVLNAEKDPTFFMSPAKVVASYRCYNLNPQKFENLLHKFFGKVRLETEIIDKNNIRYSANEWFIAPLNIIDQVVKLIITGEIVNYSYDEYAEELKIA